MVPKRGGWTPKGAQNNTPYLCRWRKGGLPRVQGAGCLDDLVLQVWGRRSAARNVGAPANGHRREEVEEPLMRRTEAGVKQRPEGMSNFITPFHYPSKGSGLMLSLEAPGYI